MSRHLSSQRLTSALFELGLKDLAKRAARDEFNDYFSPHAFPMLNLVSELNQPGIKHMHGVKRLIERVKQGEFEATEDEGVAWAESPEGREVFGKLLRGE
jgi:hypothetical protein